MSTATPPPTAPPVIDRVLQVVRSRPRDDGDLVVVHLDGANRVLVAADVAEGVRHLDELFLRHLIGLLHEFAADGVVLAVTRPGGRPTRHDRRLWQELGRRLAAGPPALLDLVVVGESRLWSMTRRAPVQQP